MIPHIYNGQGTISLMIDGQMKPIDTAHTFYKEIKNALKNQEWHLIPGLVNIKAQVEAAINKSTNGEVTINNGEVYYNNEVIHNTLTNRIVQMARDGFDISHMVKFLQNLMKNPSYRAVTELYDFLEAGAIPITENGTFLAYKKINQNWTDIYTGKFQNTIGSVVEMPRNKVDENSDNTCSNGLHVCSYNYLESFGSSGDDRVIICEINPMDVVSIPKDYNNTKMRVCKYTVIGEVANYKKEDTLAHKSVCNTNDIKSGKVNGTVNHRRSPDPKEVGKALTEFLENGQLSRRRLYTMCINAGLKDFEAAQITEIANDGDFKRVGKKIAYFIENEILDSEYFELVVCDNCGTAYLEKDGCTSC